MKAPIEQVKSLKDRCPICEDKLYAYWHTPASDHPECGVWRVECSKENCQYEFGDSFIDLEWLAKKFNVC